MKILLLAYAVSPYRGSEYAVAWNHISNMSKNNDLTVIYGTSGNHLGDNDDLDTFLKNNKIDNVNWHFVTPRKFTEALNYFNVRGLFPYSFYFAFKRWQLDVYKYVQENIDLSEFDVIHFQSPIGYREPGYLWKFDKPYVWGPIGGANNIDLRLLPLLSMSGKLKQLLRGVINRVQVRHSIRLKKALKSTNILLTATSENKEVFRKVHNMDSVYITENGTVGNYSINRTNIIFNNKIKLIWVGRIDASKGLKLLIDSFKHVKNKHQFEVHILGDGPLRSHLETYANKLGLNDIFFWHGYVNRNSVAEELSSSDLHIITSVSEANTTVLLEAIQHGVPTMTLDHCGMRDTVTSESGIKIDIEKYPQLVTKFSNVFNDISSGNISLSKLQPGVKESFMKLHWDNRNRVFQEAYQDAIKDWKRDRK